MILDMSDVLEKVVLRLASKSVSFKNALTKELLLVASNREGSSFRRTDGVLAVDKNDRSPVQKGYDPRCDLCRDSETEKSHSQALHKETIGERPGGR